ncbi:class I SAM-dependent methyltransferase [Bacillus sp. 2205SS5-2]|uniref:class I SAM-dependent methyltransferase n=1 Tax=Bacillus sp. 2205SS5-2 TaxID=3109031 RepID=UPI003004AC95
MDIKKKVQKQFSQSAGSYVKSEIHANGEDLHELIRLANVTKKDRVLDIATGGGHVANGLAPLVKEVVALDLTERMLQKAEAFIRGNGYTNVSFIVGDAEKLPFPDEAFSVVTCRIAPHHFPNIEQFIAESIRVLQEKGTLLLIDNVAPEKEEWDVFYNTVEKKRDPSHYRAWKKTEWLKLIEEKEFQVKQLIVFSKTFSFESWFARMRMPENDKEELEEYMLNASGDTKHHFQIQEENGRVTSFNGQSVLIVAKK